ncbi:uncharacterized protein IL334_002154 [Kwoniella shivajii]|uniref:RNA polymerase II degradation factor 1 n=1 Tax=Kwoniella shivajii TaxID=564305 RepID=A0ABZ1CWZ0_9TREE|nr:hypothetical protein IL334_002154 [Kwoniella shivajii]
MASVDELAVKYSSQLSQLQSIFPSWDEGDLVFTLQDTKGNVEEAALSITEGRASQFTSATKKKPVKSKETYTKGHSNRNADTGGWEAVNGDAAAGRGERPTRGGRGGARGGRGGRGGEPFRGGRGGRGGFRGGRGGLSNANGHSKPTTTEEFPTTTATTTEGWANQVQQATSAEQTDGEAPAETSNGDDFSGAGGWGDAPAPKELEKAAKTGGTGWQKEIEKPIQVASSSVPPAAKPKLTWAQIAKPAEKPKPIPAPVPVVSEAAPEPEAEQTITSDEPVAQDDVEVAPEVSEETPVEDVEAFGDAPAPEEIEEEAAALESAAAAEEPFTAAPAEDLLPEEAAPAQPEAATDAWESDPAIAGSGAQPDWAKTEAAPAIAPEPVTTYQGPPGFNSVVAKAAPGVQAAQQPRSSSRAAQRYKDAEGQGVVLPPTAASGISGVEMQFGSLSFGGINGDGVDSPVPAAEPKPESPIQAAPAPAPVAASPVRSTQPSAPAQAQQPSAPTPVAAPSAPSAPFYSQPQQTAQPSQPQPQQQQSYTSPHQTLQQQMQAYQYLQQQQNPSHSQSQDQGLHPSQNNQYYRQQDFYNPIGSQAQQQQQQPTEAQGHQQGQAQQSAQPQQPASSPYDAPFGAFGQQSHLFGQPAQQQNQHAQTNDPYGSAQRAYDSYTASGYPRPPVDEPKAAAPTPTHAASAPAQPPHQQSGYYSQMGNMGYYQQGPYNPYYQYGQAPQAGFQQYYPLAGRNLYGQPAPQAPPAPIPSNKPQPPTSQSPYGGPPSYPSSASYDDQSFGGGLGRYGESKTQSTPGAGQQGSAVGVGAGQSLAPGSYNQQGLHNFLGTSNTSTTGGSASSQVNARAQATTPDDGFKSSASSQQQGGAARSQNQIQQGINPNNAASAAAQNQNQQGFSSYPYGGAGGAGGYGGQDWGHYGAAGHYGSRNGYQQWQQ